MSVKSMFGIVKKLKFSYICFASACIFIVISAYLFDVPNKELLQKKKNLTLRLIGDALLRSNNDFGTVVPPIHHINSKTVRLELSVLIVINPDSLVSHSLKYLDPEISKTSIVRVLDTRTEETVYGFEINHAKGNKIPCLGRVLPKSNYLIEVNFYDQRTIPITPNLRSLSLSGASLVFVFLGFILLKREKSESKKSNFIEVNGLKLDNRLGQLMFNDTNIQLTDKETQILAILLGHVNNLVSRDYLIQEVWLKKGVVTGRSLDMYISRLRKKMESLSNTQIVNQHGKGYTLKIV